MKLPRATPLLAFLGAGALLWAEPTAPVDPAQRNATFAPAESTQTPEVKPAAAQKRPEPKTPAQATVAKPIAPLADRRAPLDVTPRREPVQAPTARLIVPATTTPHPGSLTAGVTVLRPADSPVRTTQGSRFQSALQSARAASATRAAEYQRQVKLEKVNEFVPTAKPPTGAVRAGSGDQPGANAVSRERRSENMGVPPVDSSDQGKDGKP